MRYWGDSLVENENKQSSPSVKKPWGFPCRRMHRKGVPCRGRVGNEGGTCNFNHDLDDVPNAPRASGVGVASGYHGRGKPQSDSAALLAKLEEMKREMTEMRREHAQQSAEMRMTVQREGDATRQVTYDAAGAVAATVVATGQSIVGEVHAVATSAAELIKQLTEQNRINGACYDLSRWELPHLGNALK